MAVGSSYYVAATFLSDLPGVGGQPAGLIVATSSYQRCEISLPACCNWFSTVGILGASSLSRR